MAILTQEIKEFIKKVKLAFVATVCPDGTPNLSPKGTTTVWDEEHLVFADIHSPGTTENIRANSSVEINIVDVFLRKGYRFKGIATILSQGSLFEQILSFYKSEGLKFAVQNIVLIKIERIQPVFSPAYDLGVSEEEVVKRWTAYWNSIDSFS
jgi:predicted pyridoxine 5'-phosphate oxidase superfamily flavin-nucleotide-binding protein